MAESELNILLKLIDNASAEMKSVSDAISTGTEKIKSSMEKASRATVSFANQLRQVGKNISQLGQSLIFFGASLTGPFLLALKNSAALSSTLYIRLDTLKAIFNDLQKKMATAVIPILDKFIVLVNNLNRYLNSLSPAISNNILQTVFLSGIFLTITGIIVVLIGKIITLSAGIIKLSALFLGFSAANPVIVIVTGLIIILIGVMVKFKDVADVVMSTFEILFLFLKNGFQAIVWSALSFAKGLTDAFIMTIPAIQMGIDAIQQYGNVTTPIISTFEVMFLFLKNGWVGLSVAIQMAVQGILQVTQWVIDKAAMIPGPMQEMFKGWSAGIQGTINNLQSGIETTLAQIEANTAEIDNIFRTGAGNWVNSLEPIKTTLGEIQQSAQETSLVLQLAMDESAGNIEMNTQRISLAIENGSSNWAKGFQKFKDGIAKTTKELLNFRGGTEKVTKFTVELWNKQVAGTQNALSLLSSSLTQASMEHKKFGNAAKVVAIALAIVNTAMAITNALATPPVWLGITLAVIVGAAGAIQIATIAATKFHTGGMIRAHNGLAVDDVPIIAQTGEGILSRKGMAALGGDMELNRLNAGQGGNSNTSIYIENALFRNDSDTEETLLTISRLIEQKRRARI